MILRLGSSSGASLLAAAALVAFASTGCGDDEDAGTGGSGGAGGATTSTTDAATTTTSSASTGAQGGGGGGAVCGGADTAGCDHVIEPGDDDAEAIQAVLIDDAQSGDVVCLCPGTFEVNREISLAIPDVTIRGVGDDREAVVLDFAGQTVDDDGVSVDSDGFTIEHLTIKNTPGNGIVVRGAEDVTFRDLLVTWDGEPSVENGAYAVYPVQCSRVLVEDCEVYGAADAGIYVGQSETIIVRNNVVHGNVAGIEIENSSDADVYGNDAYDNTAGILVFVLPNLEKKDGARAKIHDNTIRQNNRVNFAEPGTIVASVPSGIGMLVLAADETEIHDNVFTENDSSSIVMVSWPTMTAIIEDAGEDPGTDQFITGVYIHDNTFEGNGADPQGILTALPAPLEDVVWDGVEETADAAEICLSADPPTFRNLHGAANIAMPENHTTDTTPHECEGDELPAQDF